MRHSFIFGLKAALFLLPFITTGHCFATEAAVVAQEDQVEIHTITLGAVQSKIKTGVSGDEVIAAIGSPNIITSGEGNTETWVYDKLSIEQETTAAVAADAQVDNDQTAASVQGRAKVKRTKTERTMMVIVKFDSNKRVSNVQYRESTY